MGKKIGKMFLLISQKWPILQQSHWSKGVINSFKGLKWGIACLCKSNSSWDMTKDIRNVFLKNPQFRKKNCQNLTRDFFPFLPSAIIIKVVNGWISPFMS